MSVNGVRKSVEKCVGVWRDETKGIGECVRVWGEARREVGVSATLCVMRNCLNPLLLLSC